MVFMTTLLLTSSTDETIVIDWTPDIAAVGKFDTVRISVVPNLKDLSLFPLAHIRFHEITDLETKLVRSLAIHETLVQSLLVKVTTDKDETAFTFLIFFPLRNIIRESSAEKHVHTLKHELAIHSLDGENTLVSEQII